MKKLRKTYALIVLSSTIALILTGCGTKTVEVTAPGEVTRTSEVKATVERTAAVEVTLTPVPTLVPTLVPGSEALSKLLQTSNRDIDILWKGSPHANTQADVASELADERSGQTPDEVIHDVDAENCIACHGPTAVLANGGMSEAQALGYFFTTVDGKFTSNTAAENVSAWTDIACTACHNVPNDYPDSPVTLGLFDSSTGTYSPVGSASELCGQCHGNLRFKTDHETFDTWKISKHSNTQADVAVELSEARSGQTPDEVIQGQEPENCIACHAPTAVLANGGMNEAQALGYFFATSDGKFTTDVAPDHSTEWPSVACTACHDQHNPDKPAYFNSTTKKHVVMGSASELCGQCHGSLRFPDTDHLTFDAWKISKHSNTQADVAVELSEARSGQTPEEVIQGQEPENCIACHAPTAVLANGGMNEAQALGYFFTTSDGKFTTDVAPDHSTEWPSVACTACHDQHNPDKPAYFNSAIKGYEQVASTDELCGQCHGSLRFPDTDHLSYDILRGTGGIGVSDQQTMPKVTCSDCHMFVSEVDDSHSAMQHGHSWAITVEEEDSRSTIACISCHPDEDTETADAAIAKWKSDFQSLHEIVQGNVAAAEDAMQGVDNMDLQAKLDEAQHNLEFAESDESGGFHNHDYLMALLTDANDRALEVLSALGK